MKEIFPRGMPISIQGDGSLDSGLDEKEALLLRFIGKNGEPASVVGRELCAPLMKCSSA